MQNYAEAVLGRTFASMKRTVRQRLGEAWTLANTFFDITGERHIFLLASGIAFNQVLCLIPFGLVAVGIASAVLDAETTRTSVQTALQSILPAGVGGEATAAVLAELTTVFNYGSLAGWIAGGVLVWTASALFSALRTGLNAIFHIPTPKFFLIYRLKDMLLTVVTVVLIILATVLTPLMTVIEDVGMSILPDSTERIVLGVTARAVSLIAATLLFVVLYRFVPNRRLPWPVVVISTVSAVVLWELARTAFAWYVTSASDLGRFYGGYVVLASLALWMYYSSLIFLLSAELGQFVHLRRTEHRTPEV